MQTAPPDNSRLPRLLFCHKRLKDTPRFQAKATFATPGINIVPLRSTAPDSSNRLTAWSAARTPKIATIAHRRARKGSSLTGCRPTKILRELHDSNSSRSCPFWVKSRHRIESASCPLCPQKRTLVERVGMSALCQKRTSRLINHLIGRGEQ